MGRGKIEILSTIRIRSIRNERIFREGASKWSEDRGRRWGSDEINPRGDVRIRRDQGWNSAPNARTAGGMSCLVCQRREWRVRVGDWHPGKHGIADVRFLG